MAGTPRVRAADVANAAGVSQATVSYVLNNSPGQTIPAPTRTRVLEAARALGYIPDATAAALARGISSIVILDFSDMPFGSLLGAVAAELSDAVREAGLVPVVELGRHSSDDRAHLVTLARATRPRAVFTMAPLDDATAEELSATGVRLLISAASGAPDSASVLKSAATAQVGHLSASGHTRIAYAPAATPDLERMNEYRWQGVRQSAARLGVTASLLPPAIDVESAADAVAKAIREGATAIAAYNDEVALAMLAGAHRAGVRVPEDLSVIGVDNIPQAQFALPALTSVEYPLTTVSMAPQLKDALTKTGTMSLEDESAPSQVVVRESVAPPAP